MPLKTAPGLQVFGIEYRGTRRPRRVNDQGVPKRNLRKAVQFDRRDYTVRVKTDNPGASQDLDLPLRHLRRQPRFARGRYEVFLQYGP